VEERCLGKIPLLVAHNISFDIKKLRQEIQAYKCPPPKQEWRFACSLGKTQCKTQFFQLF
jgi:hypothetical protein